MLKHRPGRQTWIWPSEAVFIRQNNYPLYPGHPFRTQLLRAGARMLCEKDRKRDSDTEQRIHYFDGVLPFPVIQSFGKNVLWEKRESAIWHKAKNLLHWWHFTAFLLTVIDPSHSLRMTSYREYRFYQTKGCWKFGTWKKNLHSNPSCHSLERVSSNHCISDEECFMYNSF